MTIIKDCGHPESFILKIPKFWAWADKLGRKIWGHLGYFRTIYQHPFWDCGFLVHVFHYLISHYFNEKCFGLRHR